MTDKELLELAAKAAGIELIGFVDVGCWSGEESEWGFQTKDFDRWNPLTDDGDALRLAVKLDMEVNQNTALVKAPDRSGWKPKYVVLHIEAGDKYAATRRAIVRAAAEIGKDKQNATD